MIKIQGFIYLLLFEIIHLLILFLKRNTIPEQEEVPPRPIPQRTETQLPQFNPFSPFAHNTHFRGGGITFSAGIGPGLFPFQMNLGPNGPTPLTPQQQQEAQRSKFLLLIAFFILAATIFLN